MRFPDQCQEGGQAEGTTGRAGTEWDGVRAGRETAQLRKSLLCKHED